MAKKLYEESNISAIASAIRAKNGLSSTYSVSAMAAAILSITPKLEELSVSANGSYSPTQGKDGFSNVVVSVPSAVMSTLEVSSNGSYSPGDGVDGFNNVVVSVPAGPAPVLVSLSVSENSTYTPGTGVDGFSEVIVDVPTSAAPVLESLEVSINGTYTPSVGIDGFNEVVVSVQAGGSGEFPTELLESSVWSIVNSTASFVASQCFCYNSCIKTVNLSAVTELKLEAFFSCTKLTNANLPACETLGNAAFRACVLLASVSLSKVLSIPNSCFSVCSSLITVGSLFEEVKYIGNDAFYKCHKLPSLIAPNVITIGQSAFMSCSALSSISLPNCTWIGPSAFSGCYNISGFLSLSKIQTLNTNAFVDCSKITGVYLPECSFLSDVFKQCKALESVYLLSNTVVTCINRGDNCFYGTPITVESLLGHYGSIYVPESLYSEYIVHSQWASVSARIVGYAPPPEIVPFSTATGLQMAALISAAHAGIFDLQQDAGWAVGDTKTISISSFTGDGWTSTHSAQDVEIVITSFDEYNNAGNVLQFDFKNCLEGADRLKTDDNANNGGFGNTQAYSNLLPNLVAALPAWLRDLLITFSCTCGTGNGNRQTTTLSNNKLCLRAEHEITGQEVKGKINEGSRVTYYETAANMDKTLGANGSHTKWWLRTPSDGYYGFLVVDVSRNWKTDGEAPAGGWGISPFGLL